MAGRQPDSVCLICDPNPCQCFAKKPKKAAPRRVQPEAKAAPVPTPAPVQRKPSALEAMRAAAQEAKISQKVKPPPATRAQHEMSEEDALTLQALRNLSAEFEIDGPDLERYRSHLSRPATVTERATAWKARTRR